MQKLVKILKKFICKKSNHVMVFMGGRPCPKGNDNCSQSVYQCKRCGLWDGERMKWKRYRFKTYAVKDCRPLIFNPKYPWWCSGEGENEIGEYATIIAYLLIDEKLSKYWDDAFDIEFTLEKKIIFSDRFSKPNYFVKS